MQSGVKGSVNSINHIIPSSSSNPSLDQLHNGTFRPPGRPSNGRASSGIHSDSNDRVLFRGNLRLGEEVPAAIWQCYVSHVDTILHIASSHNVGLVMV